MATHTQFIYICYYNTATIINRSIDNKQSTSQRNKLMSHNIDKSKQIKTSPNQLQLQSDEEQQSISNKSQKSHFRFLVFVIISCILFVCSQYYLINHDLNNVISSQSHNEVQQKQFEPVTATKQQQIPNSNSKIDNRNPNLVTNLVIRAIQKQKQAVKYYGIDQKQQHAQLPFCIIISNTSQSQLGQILTSIQQQQYTNIKIIINSTKELPLNSLKFAQISYILFPNNSTYSQIYTILHKNCPLNSLLIFPTTPLKPKALAHINRQHQNYNIWLSYVTTPTSVSIVALYIRLYQLLQSNDFNNTNHQYLQSNHKELIAIGLLELCALHSKQLQYNTIFKQIPQYQYQHISSISISYYQVPSNSKSQIVLTRQPYTAIYRLSQDFQNSIIFDPSLKAKAMTKQPFPQLNLTLDNMLLSMVLQQLPYLPINHSVAALQYKYYKKYNISKYSTNNNNSNNNNTNNSNNNVRFCVTILNHNNAQHHRYRKLLRTILMQTYTNYHIVFMDDYSNDNTIEKVKQYLTQEHKQFSKQRIKYIRNSQRMFATYNILNAAYQYCNTNDIQMLIDGDDQVIGRYAFQLINQAYQTNNNNNNTQVQPWLVYSNYKSNLYHFGRSRPILSQSQHLSANNTRNFISYIGPIRTYNIKLLYNIPLQYHRIQNSTRWLDTAYDDALQYCMLQLSSYKRAKYIPQILYQYNRKYGDNDDATPQRLKYRNKTYTKQILTRKPLKMLNKEQFQTSERDKEIMSILEKDKGIIYQQV